MFCTNVSLHPWKPWCLCSAAIMIVLPLHPTQIVVVTSAAFHPYIDFRESAGKSRRTTTRISRSVRFRKGMFGCWSLPVNP
ncbi:hypothetical protein B0H21DRAFT_761546, partial [Amylocystis lapponica]